MFVTPDSTKSGNNRQQSESIIIRNPPPGFHYWSTTPSLISENNPTRPLRPNSNLSRPQEYVDLYYKTTDPKVWLCCVAGCNCRIVKMSTEK